MTVTEGNCPPDSVVDSPETSDPAAQRALRARARERASSDVRPGGQSSGQFEAFETADGDRRPGVWPRLKGWVTPPDIWAQDRPGLRKTWGYACRGEWTTPRGLPRRAGQAYAVFAVTVKACLYGLDWIVERPSRHLAAWVLVIAAARVPPLSWLIELPARAHGHLVFVVTALSGLSIGLMLGAFTVTARTHTSSSDGKEA